MRGSGRTLSLGMLCEWKMMSSFQQISFYSLPVSRRVSVTSKRLTLMGMTSDRCIVHLPHENSSPYSETNLKIKQASPQTAQFTSPHLVTALHGSLRSEHPNNSLYTYEGTMELLSEHGVPKQVPLGPDQMLLRGAQIRNTPWTYGLVVFTGHETKLMRNAT